MSEKKLPRPKEAKLTDENRKESALLKHYWEQAKPKLKLTQEAFGQKFGIGNQGAVWQCLNGQGMPISMKAALGFAEGLGVAVRDFSPRLADEIDRRFEFSAAAAGGDPFDDWRLKASPLSQEVIERLSILAQMNALQDSDWQIIDAFVKRFSTPQTPTIHNSDTVSPTALPSMPPPPSVTVKAPTPHTKNQVEKGIKQNDQGRTKQGKSGTSR